MEQISKCDPPSAFWLYKLAVNPAINAPPSDQIIIDGAWWSKIIGGAWWSKYQHVAPPNAFVQILVEQISKCDPAINAPPRD